MKKLFKYFILMILIVCFSVSTLNAKKKNVEGEAKIKFTEKVYDFGVIAENGGPVSHEFQFTNEGDGNFLILDARAECGCTRPSYPAEPIAPGKKKSVKVTYNPAGRPGPFEKTGTLTPNGHPRKIRLKIRGTAVKRD